jgi:predicted dehydrogenase
MNMKQQSKIKIAVIGIGAMGNLHARDIEALECTELAAICDTNPTRADKYAEMYGVPAFYDHQEMLAKVDLEAV